MSKKIIGVTVGTPISPSKIKAEIGTSLATPNTLVKRDDDGDIALPETQSEGYITEELDYAVSGKAVKRYVDEKLGDIDTALDAILAIQNSLIGGDA